MTRSSSVLSALALALASVAVLAACDRSGKSGPAEAPARPVPALPSKAGRDGIPEFALAKELSTFESARTGGLLRWGDAIVARRDDGFHEIDAATATARRLQAPGIATIADIGESGGRAYALGDRPGGNPPALLAREGGKWTEVALPPDLKLARGLRLAGGEEVPAVVTPLEAWRQREGKWVDFRFQGMFVPFRQGSKFLLGDRVVSASVLGSMGGQAKWVDLSVTPRVWKDLGLPSFYDLTAIAPGGRGRLWAGGSRVAGGMRRSAIFEGLPGELKALGGVELGKADESWPSVLGILPRATGEEERELLLLLTSGIARLRWARSKPEPEPAIRPETLVRFDFPVEALFDFVEDGAGNLYFATEDSGVFQLRLPEPGRAEIRRVRF